MTELAPPTDPRRMAPRTLLLLRLGVVLSYAILAVVATWPLAVTLDLGLTPGTDPTLTVPNASAWALWWPSAAIAGPGELWHAPIFHPAKWAFAISEPMLLLGLLSAPLFWLGASVVTVHNLVLLSCLLLNGVVAWRALAGLGLHSVAAVAGGAMALMLPYVHQELGVLALVPIFGLTWFLAALVRWAADPSPRRGAALGAAFAVTYLCCGQYGLFVALVAAPAALFLLRQPPWHPAPAKSLGIALAVVAIATGPLVWAQLQGVEAHQLARPAGITARGAISAGAWAATPWPALVPLPGIRTAAVPGAPAVFPGALKLALALAGIAYAWRRQRRLVAFGLTVALLGASLAMAPRWELGGWSPYATLRDWIPGLAQIRSPWRAAALTQLMTVVFAAVGLHAALGALRQPGIRPGVVPTLLLAVGMAAAVEIWPRNVTIEAAPAQEAWQDVVALIEQHSAPGAPLALLPFPEGEIDEFVATTEQMILQPQHGRPMINGYSSYFPAPYRQAAEALRDFPDFRSVAFLRDRGVQVVLVDRVWRVRQWREPDPSLGIEPIAIDSEAGVGVLRILPSSAAQPVPPEQP